VAFAWLTLLPQQLAEGEACGIYLRLSLQHAGATGTTLSIGTIATFVTLLAFPSSVIGNELSAVTVIPYNTKRHKIIGKLKDAENPRIIATMAEPNITTRSNKSLPYSADNSLPITLDGKANRVTKVAIVPILRVVPVAPACCKLRRKYMPQASPSASC
jgi:hypothetical protein